MADDYDTYIGENPDITSGNTADKESIIGSTVGGIMNATQKVAQTLGSFREKFNQITSTPFFTTLKNIGGRLVINGEGVYDPTRNAVIIGGMTVVGVVDCTIKMESTMSSETGLDGTTIAYSGYKTKPSMDLTLLRTSPSRQAFNHAYTIMSNENRGVLPVIIQDNGDTVFQGVAVITRMPDIKLDIEGSDITYTFQFI